MKYKAFILAGGRGTRLWPLSTNEKPKQFLKLYSDKSLIQETYDRAAELCDDKDIYVITTKDLEEIVQEQLPGVRMILEPGPKNTAPCLYLAVKSILKDSGDEDMIVSFHADHYIGKLPNFIENVKNCSQLIEKENSFGLIGIDPTGPNTGYGYIHYENNNVKGFKEKPSLEVAKEYLASGDYLWNSGIFMGTVKVFDEAFKKYCPSYEDTDILENLEDWYSEVPKAAFDTAILEKHPSIKVVKSEFSWDDLGAWTSLEKLGEDLGKVNQGNVLLDGDLNSIDSIGNIIHCQGLKVSLLGVKDLVIVKNNEELFIAQKSHLEKIKKFSDN